MDADQTTQIARRVIEVTPDQVIGPPRKRKRKPRTDPLAAGTWCAPPWVSPGPSPNEPTQQGFGHFDQIAQKVKQ